jgi:anti-anti-sigma regulatory factor
MLRITTDDSGPKTLVRADGRVEGPGALELERVCAEEAGPISLDLSNVSHADAEGLRVISALMDEGTELLNVPTLIQMLLEQRRAP